MPSFDIVSEIDHHELTNAVDQMNREVGNRFDFKGSDAKIEVKDGVMNVEAQTEFQVKQMHDIIYKKLAARDIDTGCLERGKIEERGMRASGRQERGIDTNEHRGPTLAWRTDAYVSPPRFVGADFPLQREEVVTNGRAVRREHLGPDGPVAPVRGR